MQTAEQRDAWLEERRQGIGASEVGILFGVSPYGSLLSLYANKVGSPAANIGDGIARRVGHELEEFVLKLAGEETGFEYKHNTRSIALANSVVRATPDAFVYDESRAEQGHGVADAKVVGAHNVGEWLEGGIPLDYELQLQTQMLVCGCTWGILAGLLLGAKQGFIWHRIEADLKLQAIIQARVAWFWNEHVLPRVPPEADDHPATERALTALHPMDNGMLIQLGKPLAFARMELESADRDLKAAKKRVALRKNQLRLALGDATFGEFPDGTGVSLKTQRTGHGGTTRVLRTMKPRAVSAAKKTCEDRLDSIIKGK
jgi:predicted phage-related endonuclease